MTDDTTERDELLENDEIEDAKLEGRQRPDTGTEYSVLDSDAAPADEGDQAAHDDPDNETA